MARFSKRAYLLSLVAAMATVGSCTFDTDCVRFEYNRSPGPVHTDPSPSMGDSHIGIHTKANCVVPSGLPYPEEISGTMGGLTIPNGES